MTEKPPRDRSSKSMFASEPSPWENMEILPNNATLRSHLLPGIEELVELDDDEVESLLEFAENLSTRFREDPISEENLLIISLLLQKGVQMNSNIPDTYPGIAELVEFYEQTTKPSDRDEANIEPSYWLENQPKPPRKPKKPKLSLVVGEAVDELPLFSSDNKQD